MSSLESRVRPLITLNPLSTHSSDLINSSNFPLSDRGRLLRGWSSKSRFARFLLYCWEQTSEIPAVQSQPDLGVQCLATELGSGKWDQTFYLRCLEVTRVLHTAPAQEEQHQSLKAQHLRILPVTDRWPHCPRSGDEVNWRREAPNQQS